MDKNRFEDYTRVEKAFKAFVHALVWESFDICAGAESEEVNDVIEKYVAAFGESRIEDVYNNVSKFDQMYIHFHWMFGEEFFPKKSPQKLA